MSPKLSSRVSSSRILPPPPLVPASWSNTCWLRFETLAPRACLVYADDVPCAEEISTQIAACLRTFGGIRAAFLFGSRVRGTPRNDSDLDLAIAFEHGASEQERMHSKLDIIDAVTAAIGALGERLDIVDLDAANSVVAFRAVRDGILVYERTRSERVEVVARVCARASDDAYYRTRSAQMAKRNLAKLNEVT
jgi:uncharacterized protein